MNSLASLGLILLIALLAGHAVKFIRVPEVTGYIVAGIILGPSVLGWISHDNVVALSVFSEVVLGLILFSIGSVFEWSKVKEIGIPVARITLTESVLAGVLVATGMLLLGLPWQASILLGAIAMETAAASTLMVIRECNSEGPLSQTLLGLIGINNIICLVGFYIVVSVIELGTKLGTAENIGQAIYTAAFPLPWQLIGSVALGYLIGLLISTWASKVEEHGETLMLLVGGVLLSVGLCQVFELSSLIASLAVGASMVNLSAESRRMFAALSRSDPPFYAIFFVLAGAELNLSLLKTMGFAGVVYIIGRLAGKFFGARYATKRAEMPDLVQRWLGVSILSQAGLAVGLTLAVNQRFPEFGPTVTTVVLAAVAFFEMVGPISARYGIERSGEIQAETEKPVGLLG